MLHFTCSRIVHNANAKFRIYDIWKLPPKGKMCVIHSGEFSWQTSAGLKVSSPILSLGINLVEASKMGMNFYWRCIKKSEQRRMYEMIHKKWLRIFFYSFYTFLGLWLTCQRNPMIGLISDSSETLFLLGWDFLQSSALWSLMRFSFLRGFPQLYRMFVRLFFCWNPNKHESLS